MAAKRYANDDSGKERYTFFYQSGSPFSQFHPCEFTVDGVQYNCAEQYMMHQKALLFGDKDMAKQIMFSNDPKKMKSCGRNVTPFDPDVWTEKCRDVVKKGNLAKFGQNEHLWREMERTIGTVLVEASPRDRLWGIGLGASNPKALNKATWRGKNWLGYTLTEVREELLATKGAEMVGEASGGEVKGEKPESTSTVTASMNEHAPKEKRVKKKSLKSKGEKSSVSEVKG